MADYETISEGSHCVRHDMFGQCIYTHNNFSKGNSRLYGMPEKEEKIRGGGESPPKPKPKPDTPLTPLKKVEGDGPPKFSYQGSIKERVTGTLTQQEIEMTHIMRATGMNQSYGDSPLGRARGQYVAQQYLNEVQPGPAGSGGKFTVDERSTKDVLLVRRNFPSRDTPRGTNARALPGSPGRTGSGRSSPDAVESKTGGTAKSAAEGLLSKVRGAVDKAANLLGDRVGGLPGGDMARKGIGAGKAKLLEALDKKAASAVDAAGKFDSAVDTAKKLIGVGKQKRSERGSAADSGRSTRARQNESRKAGKIKARRKELETNLESAGDTHANAVRLEREHGTTYTERTGLGTGAQPRPGDRVYDKKQWTQRSTKLQNNADDKFGKLNKARKALEKFNNENPKPEPAAEAPKGAPKGTPEPEPAGVPEPQYLMGLPGSRTNMSEGTAWDWLGNAAYLIGEPLQSSGIGKLMYKAGSKFNEEQLNTIVDTIAGWGIPANQLEGLGGNSRAGANAIFAANRLGPDRFGGKVFSRNSPPMSGQDEAGASLGDRLHSIRTDGDWANSMRASLLHYIAMGGLGPPPGLVQKGGTTKTIPGEGDPLHRHMVGGPLDKVAFEAYMAGGQFAQMQHIHDRLEINPNDDLQGARTNLLDDRQKTLMRGSREDRLAAISHQEGVKNAAETGRTRAAAELRRYNTKPTRMERFGKGVAALNFNLPLAIGGGVVALGAGIGLDELEDSLHIGLNSYYARPAANAAVVNVGLEGLGSWHSGGKFFEGVTGTGAFAAVGSALIGAGVGKLWTPKDGFTTRGGAHANMLGQGAVGGAAFAPLAKGANYIWQKGTTALSGGGAGEGGGTAAAIGGDAAAVVPAATTGVGGAGSGVAAVTGEGGGAAATAGGVAAVEGGGAGAAATAGSALADLPGAATAAAAAEEGGALGAWAGPLGILGGAAIGLAFSQIGWLMEKSKIGKAVDDNATRLKDKIKDEALKKANALRLKGFGRLSGMDFQNLSQSALNVESGGTADPAAFLG